MKKIILAITTIITIVGVGCANVKRASDNKTDSTKDQKETNELVPYPKTIDLGAVKEGDKAKGKFKITNNGDRTLFILGAASSCGCTVGAIQKKILAPGESTTVSGETDTTAKRGKVRKTITVMTAQGVSTNVDLVMDVTPNPHSMNKGIFDGKCRSCHFDPARGVNNGKKLFASLCSMCHGSGGEGGYAPGIKSLDVETLKNIGGNGTGSNIMPGFLKENGGPLSNRQLDAIVEWIHTESPQN